MFRLLIWGRTLVEALFTAAGFFDLRPALRPRSPRKSIAFEAYASHLAQGFEPIIARLQQNFPGLEIHFIILSHPHFSFRSLLRLREFAQKSLRIPRSHVHFFWQVLWRKFDVLVCTDVYARFPLRSSKRILLKHGAGVARRIVKPHPLRKTIFDFDLVLLNGQADYDLLRRYCTNEFIGDRVAVAGLPYLDRLTAAPETREAYLRRIGHSADRRVALVAPSWRGLQVIHSFYPRYLSDIVEALTDFHWQVIIKMHACSFNKAMSDGRDWGAELPGYLRQDVCIDRNIDDIPALAHADLLITDISSRAFNFMLLGKPVIAVTPDGLFTDEMDRARLELIRQGASLAHSPDELRAILKNEFDANGAAGRERRRLAERIFANPGKATEVVVDHILSQMNCAPGAVREGA